ncbi:MAG: methylmalonyl-CoA mutase family protein [Planctomycetota bacterium]|nr:methylmalonyl-CoA mutase family protein [Planctomycetota bacterium]
METWRKRVEEELKGADFERALVDHAFAGVSVAPLYAASDLQGLALQEEVGCAPFVRGRVAVAGEGWANAPRYDLPHPASLRAALLEDLPGGTNAVWLQLDACTRLGEPPISEIGREAWGDGGCMLWTLQDWRNAFEGVHIHMVHLELDAGGNAMASAAMLLSLAKEREVDLASLAWNFGLDPLASLARDGMLPLGSKAMKHQVADFISWCEDHMPKARALTVSTEVYHGAGASLAQELGIMAATLVHYLQLGEAVGLSPLQVAQSTSLRMVMDRDVFPAIAGLRAARRIWSRVLEACGVTEVPAPWIHAIGSRRSLARRDPWTNQLRASTQTFAAILGRADAITTCTYDEVLNAPSTLGRRVARNTQIILAEESRLGDVADPAGGAYVFESLTEELAQEAWRFFQQIEAEGGMASALRNGWLHGQLKLQSEKRKQLLSTRRLPMTGVSSFPPLEEEVAKVVPYLGAPESAHKENWVASEPCVMRVQHGMEDLLTAAQAGADVFALTDAQRNTMPANCDGPTVEPLLLQRDAELFEDLQAECAGLEVQLLSLGSEVSAAPRIGFAETLFATAGAKTIRVEEASAGVICICGSDVSYETELAATLEGCKASGARILVAGRPKLEDGSITCIHLQTHIPDLMASLMEVQV